MARRSDLDVRRAAYRKQLEREQLHREARRLLDQTEPWCRACQVRKPRAEFHVDSFRASGVRAQCKACWDGVRRARAAAARDAGRGRE